MTISHEYAAMALATINGIPTSKWPTHQQEQVRRPGAMDTVKAYIATRSSEELEQDAAHCGPTKWVRGEFRLIRWWTGEKLSKDETKAPSCEHDGEFAVEGGLLICQQCGWAIPDDEQRTALRDILRRKSREAVERADMPSEREEDGT